MSGKLKRQSRLQPQPKPQQPQHDPIAIISILLCANGYAPDVALCGLFSHDRDLWSYLAKMSRGITLLLAASSWRTPSRWPFCATQPPSGPLDDDRQPTGKGRQHGSSRRRWLYRAIAGGAGILTLLARADFQASDNGSNTLLHHACSEGDACVVTELIKSGAGVNMLWILKA